MQSRFNGDPKQIQSRFNADAMQMQSRFKADAMQMHTLRRSLLFAHLMLHQNSSLKAPNVQQTRLRSAYFEETRLFSTLRMLWQRPFSNESTSCCSSRMRTIHELNSSAPNKSKSTPSNSSSAKDPLEHNPRKSSSRNNRTSFWHLPYRTISFIQGQIRKQGREKIKDRRQKAVINRAFGFIVSEIWVINDFYTLFSILLLSRYLYKI